MLGPLRELIVYARDMDSQVRFYRDTLGLSIVYPPERESYAEEYWVVFSTGQCSLCLHRGGSGETGSDAPKFVFAVDDIEQVRQTLLARSVAVGEMRTVYAAVRVADCRDPEGNAFSIESGG